MKIFGLKRKSFYNSMKVNIKKLHENAKIPTYAHSFDAGMDLYTPIAVEILPMQRVQMRTGIAFEIPDGYVGLIWDKSGLSHKKGLKLLGGVVDSGYRGEVLVGAVNLGQDKITFEAGEKVAQMLIQKVEHPELFEVDELTDTERGEGAFGSTGTK